MISLEEDFRYLPENLVTRLRYRAATPPNVVHWLIEQLEATPAHEREGLAALWYAMRRLVIFDVEAAIEKYCGRYTDRKKGGRDVATITLRDGRVARCIPRLAATEVVHRVACAELVELVERGDVAVDSQYVYIVERQLYSQLARDRAALGLQRDRTDADLKAIAEAFGRLDAVRSEPLCVRESIILNVLASAIAQVDAADRARIEDLGPDCGLIARPDAATAIDPSQLRRWRKSAPSTVSKVRHKRLKTETGLLKRFVAFSATIELDQHQHGLVAMMKRELMARGL